jgi:transglutaminase-like putative cysteine protease
MEVYLGGQWFSFDPRHNCRRIGRIVIGRGRDASDVALTMVFGSHTLESFSVTTEEISEELALQPAGKVLSEEKKHIAAAP